MQTIRILHVVGAMNRGGAETLLMELYRNIDRSKVQFDFLVYNYAKESGIFDEEIRKLGGRIYEAKRRFYRGPIAYCVELKTFFEKHPEYKIIHAHQYATSGYMLAMAKKSGEKITIAHSHIAFPITDFMRKCADGMGKLLLKKYADYFFGCSEDALVALTGKKANGKKLFVLKNAIDTNKFMFSGEMREAWRNKLGASEETLIIGNIARFTYQKNHEHILRVFKEILKEKSDSLLVLIGVGSRLDEMEQLAKSFGIEEKVVFMGTRGDVHDIVNSFDLFLMPSRYEGLGIVLIEAQANGLPCVISADVIPEEADVRANLVTRVSLDASLEEWVQACLSVGKRINVECARRAVETSGYDIKKVSRWLQDFYIKQWND